MMVMASHRTKKRNDTSDNMYIYKAIITARWMLLSIGPPQ